MQPVQGNSPCTNPYASKDGLAKLEGMAGKYLTPVFTSGDTTVYRVLPAAYSSGVAAGDPAPAGAQQPVGVAGQTTP